MESEERSPEIEKLILEGQKIIRRRELEELRGAQSEPDIPGWLRKLMKPKRRRRKRQESESEPTRHRDDGLQPVERADTDGRAWRALARAAGRDRGGDVDDTPPYELTRDDGSKVHVDRRDRDVGPDARR